MYSWVLRPAAAGVPARAALRTRLLGTERQDHAPLTRSVQEAGIRKITLNNPQKRNALSLAMLQSLQKDLVHEVDDKDLRVIVIAANGPVFSSGHNLKEFTAMHGKTNHADVFDACIKLMTTIQTLPVPVIAQVNGLATAAGCQLVAGCDIAIASEKSKFATPGVNVGLFCSTPAVALGRAVPKKRQLIPQRFQAWINAKKLHHTLHKDDRLKTIFPDPPLLCYRQPPNLRIFILQFFYLLSTTDFSNILQISC
ncbi:enoyl-CoA hydratase domain-containing protein 3, mitochondrial isoform X2 [Eleutherodactylus coqui]|uniref:enoyl-CoA hydratase domain-containing protein 3, mitochondrial isoform X2 n=1 Tax=Eleutherodactylus coqui TaxID=57060 RepID=UPI003461F442